MNKIEAFQSYLKNEILGGKLASNEAVLNFAYDEGHIPKHAAEMLKRMKSEGDIYYEGASPLVSYENVVKLNKIIEYKLL